MTIKKEAGRTGFSIRRRVFDKIEVRTLTWRRGHQVAVNDASPDHFITTNEKDCQGPETWWRGHQIAFRRRTLTFYNIGLTVPTMSDYNIIKKTPFVKSFF